MNSSDRILAQRYAKAYDALATSNQQAQARAEELAAASQALGGAQAFMTDPNVSVPAKTGFAGSVSVRPGGTGVLKYAGASQTL